MSPITCACDKCASMCAHSTCLPTPDEARALIRAGHAGKLAVYRFNGPDDAHAYIAPAIVGRESEVLPRTNLGPCVFFAGGLCELHDAGLKPLEGRLAHHTRDWKAVRIEVMKTWRGKRFASVCAQLERAQMRSAGH